MESPGGEKGELEISANWRGELLWSEKHCSRFDAGNCRWTDTSQEAAGSLHRLLDSSGPSSSILAAPVITVILDTDIVYTVLLLRNLCFLFSTHNCPNSPLFC